MKIICLFSELLGQLPPGSLGLPRLMNFQCLLPTLQPLFPPQSLFFKNPQLLAAPRWLPRMCGRKAPCSSSSGPSSTLRMYPRNWSRISHSACSSCKWRRVFSMMIFTAHLRLLCCWPPMLSSPSMVTSIRKFTSLVTWQGTSCFHRGKIAPGCLPWPEGLWPKADQFLLHRGCQIYSFPLGSVWRPCCYGSQSSTFAYGTTPCCCFLGSHNKKTSLLPHPLFFWLWNFITLETNSYIENQRWIDFSILPGSIFLNTFYWLRLLISEVHRGEREICKPGTWVAQTVF